jgi:hypothetical protein
MEIATPAGLQDQYRLRGSWTAATLAGETLRRAEQHPERPAVVDAVDHRTVTYGQLVEDAGRLAAWMCDQGIVAGDGVSVQLPNRYETVVGDIAGRQIIKWQTEELHPATGFVNRSGLAGLNDAASTHVELQLPERSAIQSLGGQRCGAPTTRSASSVRARDRAEPRDFAAAPRPDRSAPVTCRYTGQSPSQPSIRPRTPIARTSARR